MAIWVVGRIGGGPGFRGVLEPLRLTHLSQSLPSLPESIISLMLTPPRKYKPPHPLALRPAPPTPPRSREGSRDHRVSTPPIGVNSTQLHSTPTLLVGRGDASRVQITELFTLFSSSSTTLVSRRGCVDTLSILTCPSLRLCNLTILGINWGGGGRSHSHPTPVVPHTHRHRLIDPTHLLNVAQARFCLR
jgi:hypothetical protein